MSAVRQFEHGGGVFHVAGPDLVVRVFPLRRPLAAAEHDARVLTVLESMDIPAERLASDEPVWALDDGRAVLVTRFVPGRPCRDICDPDLLSTVADVLGRVHALPLPSDLRPGGGWHLASADVGTRADDVAALLSRITDDRLHEIVESIDIGDGLPQSLVHPDPSGANVIGTEAGPVLIDWTGAGRGARLLSFAVLLGAALEVPALATPIVHAYSQHVDLTDAERARLPGVLCGFPLLVAAWTHATWGTPAGLVVEQHGRRRRTAETLVAVLPQ
jgi:Ser/Thr protein kinase RdoA (MazF antagonist)